MILKWQKTFDRVKRTKFLQILKGNGVDWPERRLFSKLYMDQSVNVCTKGREELSGLEEEFDNDVVYR
jgi:hypothetical protein